MIFFSVIQGLVYVLVYGIVFYPFFACLTTKYKLIGSLMGFVYVAIRYEANMILWLRNGSALNTVTVTIDPKKTWFSFIELEEKATKWREPSRVVASCMTSILDVLHHWL